MIKPSMRQHEGEAYYVVVETTVSSTNMTILPETAIMLTGWSVDVVTVHRFLGEPCIESGSVVYGEEGKQFFSLCCCIPQGCMVHTRKTTPATSQVRNPSHVLKLPIKTNLSLCGMDPNKLRGRPCRSSKKACFPILKA